MMTDPIADMLTRIRNAVAVKKPEVIVPYSRLKIAIAEVMKENQYVNEAVVVKNGLNNKFDQLKLVLRYDEEGKPIIHSLKRVSTPGRRVYVNKNALPTVLNNLGIAIVSTSQGVMTNREARKRQLGGEVICEIY